MGLEILPYPTIQTTSITTIERVLKYQFDAEVIIDISGKDPSKIVSTKPLEVALGHDTIWDANIHDIVYEHEFQIQSDKTIFGPKGITPEDSTLGITLKWFSPDSNQRGISDQIISINKQTFQNNIRLLLKLPKKQFYKRVMIEPIVFLLQDITTDSNVAKYKNMWLGRLDEPVSLFYDGEGSQFPILIQSDTDTSWAWKLQYESTDPSFDSFDIENVALVLNNKHIAFNQLNTKMESNLLLLEVLSAWHLELLLCIKEEHKEEFQLIPNKNSNDLIKSGSLLPASILHYLMFFCQTHHIDFTNNSNMALSIRKAIFKTYHNQ